MPNKPDKPIPLAYFITFTTYGTWLHGDARGSVDRDHNEFGTEKLKPDRLFEFVRENTLKYPPFKLQLSMIRPVDAAIRICCNARKWCVHALNVRTNHVHLAVSGPVSPGRILGDCKRYATRRLRDDKLVKQDQRIWTEDGSKRYVWNAIQLQRVVDYILREQGPDLRLPIEG
ncbi:MAG: transposase [Planctomycetes bacterium]|nr:transposase [Planctomycetota bacterium]